MNAESSSPERGCPQPLKPVVSGPGFGNSGCGDAPAGARTPSSASGREDILIGAHSPAYLDRGFASDLQECWHRRGYLPHFDTALVVQFVTFRLADALPQSVLERLHALPKDQAAMRWRESEAGVDARYGSCVLGNPTAARLLTEVLLHDHGVRYAIHAWCVMPNHVHVLLHLFPGSELAKVVQAWKSVSTRRLREVGLPVNRKLWQEDYFDRFMRDAEHYAATRDYIHANPVKAGLVKSAKDWAWGSAWGGRRPIGVGTSRDADEGVRAPACDSLATGDSIVVGEKACSGGRGRPRSGVSIKLADRLAAPLAERAERALERKLVARPAVVPYTCLADNDYLGLSKHPEVVASAQAAVAAWGASSAASPLITGYTAEHAALERELADWCGFAHGLVWNTGFAANAAVLGSLPKAGDLVFADRLIHASMISGLLASGARLVRYPHLDLDKLESLLEKHRDHDGVVWVVTESVFSMDGDYPDLRRLAALKARYGFVLVVDEAHATGWYGATGAGLVQAVGIADAVDILVGTLGKGLGGFGAYTLFHDELFRRYLMNFAGEFVYSTYLPPVCAAAARASVRVVRAMDADARGALPAQSRAWREAIRAVVPGVPEGDSPIIPVPIGDAARTMTVAAKLLEAGWRVGAVRPPTVPEGGARLRLSLKAGLPPDSPERFASALANALS